MRPLSRYEPISDRRHIVFDTSVLGSKRDGEEYEAKASRKYFAPSELYNRKKELNEFSELRSYFVSASCGKPCAPHPSLRVISGKEELQVKRHSIKNLWGMLFS